MHLLGITFSRQGVKLSRPLKTECLQNVAEFLPLPKVARLSASCQKSLHLHGSATSKSCSIFKLRSDFCHHQYDRDRSNRSLEFDIRHQIQINQSKRIYEIDPPLSVHSMIVKAINLVIFSEIYEYIRWCKINV